MRVQASTITGSGGGGAIGGAGVAGVNVLASSPTLPSTSGQTLSISVIVRDANNVAMEGVTVILSTDSGTLTVPEPVTDASGIVFASLTAGGDPTNRAVTVTADANGVLGSVTVNVIGTTLSLSGPTALPQGDSAVSSSNGNTLAASSLTTDNAGQAQVDVTASAPGLDTLTATALGLTATQDMNVSDDSFALTAPLAGDEIVLNTIAQIDLTWTLVAATNAAGIATVTITSTNAGPAVITATNAAGTSTSVQVEFVADTPDSIDVQANPFTLGPGEQSAITAVVRDAANNLVKNAVVLFDLQDVTGGQLSAPSAVTDSQGRAQTFYTASSTTSANGGVVITGTVQSNPLINNSVALTVAKRELFISIGTGNSIFEPNTAQYRVEFAIQVSDSQGNGVEGVAVQTGILSNNYYKGFWFYDALASAWVQNLTAGPSASLMLSMHKIMLAGSR